MSNLNEHTVFLRGEEDGQFLIWRILKTMILSNPYLLVYALYLSKTEFSTDSDACSEFYSVIIALSYSGVCTCYGSSIYFSSSIFFTFRSLNVSGFYR